LQNDFVAWSKVWPTLSFSAWKIRTCPDTLASDCCIGAFAATNLRCSVNLSFPADCRCLFRDCYFLFWFLFF
jgi:hypothetical protein